MALETKYFYDFKNFRLDPEEKVLLRDDKSADDNFAIRLHGDIIRPAADSSHRINSADCTERSVRRAVRAKTKNGNGRAARSKAMPDGNDFAVRLESHT